MAKVKTWTVYEARDGEFKLHCKASWEGTIIIATMVSNAGLLIDQTDDSNVATRVLAQNMVDVLNREMPGGVARSHKRSSK